MINSGSGLDIKSFLLRVKLNADTYFITVL